MSLWRLGGIVEVFSQGKAKNKRLRAILYQVEVRKGCFLPDKKGVDRTKANKDHEKSNPLYLLLIMSIMA